jgi:hypothetical protein
MTPQHVTFLSQIPAMTNYSMAGHTYRYYDEDRSLFPFGYGLSYTTFKYLELDLSAASISEGDSITATIKVKNTGLYSSDEVCCTENPGTYIPAFIMITLGGAIVHVLAGGYPGHTNAKDSASRLFSHFYSP